MAGTARLALPFISVGQAQKEFTHNESLQALDILVAGAVEEPPLATPPTSPSVGACYIVAADSTDAWAGQSKCLAAWTSGGWRFVAPVEGMAVFERTSGSWAVFRDGAWEIGMVRGSALLVDGEQVVGPRGVAIAPPTGGAIIDSEGRAAIDAILDAMRTHGLIAS
jgi:hypothetical protein